MAIFCQKCRRHHPDDANFCMICGKPLKTGRAEGRSTFSRWEYKDIEIPLGFKVKFSGNRPQSDAGTIGDRIILTYLQHEAIEGWEPEGITDFWSLRQLGRVKEEHKQNIWGDMAYIIYPSARIRLKRRSN